MEKYHIRGRHSHIIIYLSIHSSDLPVRCEFPHVPPQQQELMLMPQLA